MYRVYTKPNCLMCQKAKHLLDQKGLQYEEIRIGIDVTRELLLEIAPHARAVPQVFLNETYIGGYNEFVDHLDRRPPDNMLLG